MTEVGHFPYEHGNISDKGRWKKIGRSSVFERSFLVREFRASTVLEATPKYFRFVVFDILFQKSITNLFNSTPSTFKKRAKKPLISFLFLLYFSHMLQKANKSMFSFSFYWFTNGPAFCRACS
ncbi:MAG: hypothetical protein UT41_C0001G0043 [Candidatus Wolfebacteria bacterium GW2011_GWC2_39_22]|uniref:Uncharacterized protein n=2 Tax=Candidatus Wolfeibacteriota TaxID=1752735 RepID=A0A0G1H7U0_9BACT|nr:MAG: hypothetical protein UT41_C0001G0043 [Candidatus Wolfebacteria bacterium GW2011_GWC2_39_22]KKT43456.1 MAG: hypothetical protein UW32_C0001G0048 [Candidatus Wolfebacteria bacterium GW2011_GWE2_44_13]HBI25292.1 hypothetical protein [Candidatus Wolfebacteria bacterium]